MLFGTIAEEWLTLHSVGIKFRTAIMYKQKVKQLTELYGNMRISDITYLDIQSLFNKLYVEQSFAKSTISKYKITLNLIFKHAMSKNIIEKNPCDFVKIPKNAKVSKRSPLSDKNVKIILDNVNINSFSLYPFMMLCLGLRRSEILPLKYEDINFEDKTIHINKVVNFINNKPKIDNILKNGMNERYVGIPDILLKKLEKCKLKKGYIFNKGNSLLTESQLEDLWDDYKIRTGFIGTQHMIRHTYATMLYKSDVDIKTAQYLMGHKTIRTTLDIYTHLEDELKAKNINKLNAYINKHLKV